MRDGNFVAIGWRQLGDLSEYISSPGALRDIKQLMSEREYPGSAALAGRKGQEVNNFVRSISERDLVLACDGATVLGVARATGGYEFESESDFPHRRPVEWLAMEEWTLPQSEGLRTTVHRMGKYPENLVETERKIFGKTPITVPGNGAELDGIPGRIQGVLARKKQVILYGPPGTGKTYWAELAARQLAAQHSFGVSYDKLAPEQMKLVDGGDSATEGMVRMCTFHPAYGYEDFLEGYRPGVVDGNLVFRPHDGIFKVLCDDAWEQPEQDFYLIIDEINRGDIPRIFGELLTVLEKDKRGRPVILPLTGEALRVPDNVYLIGTMNTADRSIALLDTALRRRFGFVELMPDSSVLGETVVSGIPLGPWLDAVNHSIVDHVGQDARNLQIGHSYLMEGGRAITGFAKLVRILQEDIIPLLEEYCYEDFSALERILGDGLVDVRNQRIRQELLNVSKQDELIQALLTPYPEISTSPQIIASEIEAPVEDEEANDGDIPVDER
jgi:5-methylcytosine-specific restriction enzyme B